MIPRLHASDSTRLNSNGFGALKCISCNVVEELNGAFELNATILADSPHIDEVVIGNIITAKPNLTSERQAFCIESVTKNIDGTVEIYATHIVQYRGRLIPVSPFTASSLSDALTALVSNSLEANPFTISTNKTSDVSMTTTIPHSFRELLGGTEGSLIDSYRGELAYDNYAISFLNRRGRDNGVKVLYGKNMTNYEETDEFGEETLTGLLPYWYSEEEGLVMGSVQYSDNADLYKYKRTAVIDLTEKFEEMPTASDLNAMALDMVSGRGAPATSIEVEFNQFATVIPNGVENVQLGDDVHVINPQYNTSYVSRIVKTDFNVLSENYNSLTIGKVKSSLYDVVSSMTGGEVTSGAISGDIAYWQDQAKQGQTANYNADTLEGYSLANVLAQADTKVLGRFAVITGQFPSSTGNVVINYPTGFGKDSVLISFGMRTGTNGYRYGQGTDSTTYYRYFVILGASNMQVHNYSATWYGADFKIVLMNVE